MTRLNIGAFLLSGSFFQSKIFFALHYITLMKNIYSYLFQRVPTDISDFEALGELGHGTCGQVIQMRHKHTRTRMAVKVSKITLYMHRYLTFHPSPAILFTPFYSRIQMIFRTRNGFIFLNFKYFLPNETKEVIIFFPKEKKTGSFPKEKTSSFPKSLRKTLEPKKVVCKAVDRWNCL